MASSNPFRKSLAPGADGVGVGAGAGKENIPVGPAHDGDAAAAHGPVKKKSVKKVRVLSPPPRSPGPREVLTSPPPPPPPMWSEADLQALGDAYPEVMSPVAGLGSPILMHPRPQAQTKIQWPVLFEAHDSPVAGGGQDQLGAPAFANPFSKALHELGTGAEEAEAEAEKPARKKSLNVDSFRRLLMTGAASPSHSPPPAPAPAPDAAGDLSQSQNTVSVSGTGSSSTPGADGFSNGRHYNEFAALSPALAQSSREKKLPPPPPSSRHGKSLKADTKESGLGATASHELLPSSPTPTEQTQTPSRPPISHGSSTGASDGSSSSSSGGDDNDDDNDSLSNDPIIKALESELNGSTTPDQELSNPLASPPVPNSAKKPVPAPPPRRGHARAESKARGIQAALSPQHSDPPSRNSMDSERSGAGSIRHSNTAPLPPPPRRPPITSRQPSATSLANPSSPNGPQNDHEYYTVSPDPSISVGKAGARPPPPPARQSSTARRPSTILGTDLSSRRVSSDSKLRESMAPPPPPPPPSRHRESSQSSREGSHRPRSSVEVTPADLPDAGDTRVRSSSSPTPNPGKSTDILADLDALQREVDALRGHIR